MRRYEVYTLFLLLIGANVLLGVSLAPDEAIIEHNVQLHMIDDLYQVDDVRFAIVRTNKEMGRACMWCDKDLDGGQQVVKVESPGVVLDLREWKGE